MTCYVAVLPSPVVLVPIYLTPLLSIIRLIFPPNDKDLGIIRRFTIRRQLGSASLAIRILALIGGL
ncbi:hypothetical protein P691DRAFT_571649 [Macrolepiota fuliginosa MF-IS2]|uniref:Uncharacterized protein n=1 Tax=Macrolepiota fuliginosa MF-IS2 TaxID=1400762 RepID=A0A9P5XE29_9AGAR|nr:hypothetical protein P691DRAFT_571649 [Macrolepiota fuliginosa MF-IS2]